MFDQRLNFILCSPKRVNTEDLILTRVNRWTNDENNYLAFVKTLVLFLCLLLVNKVELLDFTFKHSDPDKTRKVVKLNTREFKFYQQIYIQVSITTIKYIRSSKLYLLHYDCNYLCNFFIIKNQTQWYSFIVSRMLLSANQESWKLINHVMSA